MITYEQAKQLKNFGFNQLRTTENPSPRYFAPNGGIRHYLIHEDEIRKNGIDKYTRIPTPDELIEECGEGSLELHRITGGFQARGKTNAKIIWMDGKTSEEALVNLFLILALHKK